MLPVLLIFAAAPPAPDAGLAPSARDMAQLFFIAGDLRRAVDQGRRCVQTEGKKKCQPLYEALVRYEALISRNEELTKDEAKHYLEWDRLISPQSRGKLSEGVWKRWVVSPLENAQRAHAAGDDARARELCEAVLYVDPQSVDAKALLGQLPPLSR